MANFLVQSRHGIKGNFEVVVPPSHGDGLVHLWRNNDNATMPWSGPTCFGGGELGAAALIQGNYGTPGNLEVVATDTAGNLDFYWRLDRAPWTWSGPYRVASGVHGAPALIQSRHGARGNFEVVVPHRDGGLAHLWRNNDVPSMPWSGVGRFGGASRYTGGALIQGNYGTPGNLEVVATDVAGNLDFFWRLDRAPWTWSRPYRITGTVRGTPALIQSRHGARGNFEVVVPHRDGGLAHLWRNNDVPSMPWSGLGRFGGTGRYEQAALIQGNYGSPGNLEVVAVDDAGNVDFFWRLDRAPWTWSGPHRIGVERSWAVRECSYGWQAGYHQADTHVNVRIQLNPDAGISAETMSTLRTRWRDGIVDKWSNRFDCIAPDGERRALTMGVSWVNSNAHHVVRVRPGPARSNMTTWDTADSGDVASHEFGHMIGHPDEYADSACPTRNPVSTGSVMDDNTETLARHYNNITGFHCGHRPVTRGVALRELLTEVHMRFLDDLDDAERARSLTRLRKIGARQLSPEDVTAKAAELSFEVTGGAPGERYTYRVAVRGSGQAERQMVDELRGRGDKPLTGIVRGDLVAEVFGAAESVGLFDDRQPALSVTPLPPDSIVATLTVRDGDAVRRVVAPALEPGVSAQALPGEPAEVPLRSDVRLPDRTVSALQPVLDALARVEDAL